MKYIKLFEGHNDINFIQDIKDMSLEYIDNGLTLRVEAEDSTTGFTGYILVFNHEINSEKELQPYLKRKKFNIDLSIEYTYYIYLFNPNIAYNPRYTFYSKPTEELVDRLQSAYPKYDIRVGNNMDKNRIEL